MEYKNIIFEKRDGIGYVTMNRERALNALNTEVLTELDHVFGAIDQDEEVKIAIITGKGRAFIAGADIGQMAKLSGPEGRDMTIQGQQVMERIESITKPVIAAINGFALGGGNELSMACDIRIASEKAKFGQPEVNLGIMSKAPISIKMAKVAINNGINCDLKIGVQFEAEAYTSTFVSADRVEGMTAFVEKRPAEFKNR